MNRDHIVSIGAVTGIALIVSGCSSAPEGPHFQGGAAAYHAHSHTAEHIGSCDFNGDDRPGFVVSGPLPQGQQRTTVLTTGSGRLTTGLTLERGFGGLAAADLDGDGHCDFAGLTGGEGSASRSVFRIFYGAPDDRFPTTVSRSADPAFPRALAAGRIGGDGITDLAVFYKTFPAEDDTMIFPGSPDRDRPRPPTGHRLGATAAASVATDLDGDDDTDLAALTTDRRIRILANRPGPFRVDSSRAYGNAAETDQLPAELVAGDFDADGDSDLAVADPEEARVFLFAGDTRPAIAATYRFSGQAPPQDLAATDLDGDGRDDLVVLRQGPDGPVLTGMQVRAEDDSPSLRDRGDHRVSELSEASRLRLTDLDQSGGPDAVVWGQSGDEPGMTTVRDLTIVTPPAR